MSMDHAEAHERIADLALDREALARLTAHAPSDRPFLEHVEDCTSCRADLAGLRALDRGLRDALGEVRDAATLEPINPPESLRDTVLAAARREPRLAATPRLLAQTTDSAAVRGMAAPRRSPFGLPRLSAPQWSVGLAAALVIAIAGGFAGRALAPAGGGPDASMVAAVATLDRVLAAPDHHLVSLTTPAGAAAGSVGWSAQDFVVLTSALSAPPAGRTYRCWLQWAGKWTVVGEMEFAGTTAYWTGPTGDWAQLLADPGTRFVVTAESAATPGERPAGAVILQASLGT